MILRNLKNINGYEGLYQISSDGYVYSIKSGILIKPWITNKGYLCVDLAKNGQTKHCLLHRLLAEHFIPNPNNYPVVMHRDNNKLNLSLDNLSWGTYSENNSQAIRDGLKPLPRPDNRKYYAITNGERTMIGYGHDQILNAIGYGTLSMINNMLHRHKPIVQGPYEGYYIEALKKDGRSTIIP